MEAEAVAEEHEQEQEARWRGGYSKGCELSLDQWDPLGLGAAAEEQEQGYSITRMNMMGGGGTDQRQQQSFGAGRKSK